MTRAKPKATAPASGRALVRRACSRAAASSQAPGTNRGRSPATNSDDDSPLVHPMELRSAAVQSASASASVVAASQATHAGSSHFPASSLHNPWASDDSGAEDQDLGDGSSDDDPSSCSSSPQSSPNRSASEVFPEDEPFEEDEKVVAEWRMKSYASSTIGEASGAFKKLKEWHASHPHKESFGGLQKPFSRSLCIQYMRHQSSRQIPWTDDFGVTSTRHVESGTLNTHYRMLLFYGFDESVQELKCPDNLKAALRSCIRAHARSLPQLKNQGMHPHEVLSEPIPWEATTLLHQELHCVQRADGVAFEANMFSLELTQGLYRQQLCGFTSLPCLALAAEKDMVVVNISGGKCDQEGTSSYGKRFGCNPDEPHNCFPTALGRHFFSRQPDDNSNYLYMTDKQAADYECKRAALVARNEGSSEPTRVRCNGPHTRFRRHISRVIHRMHKANSAVFGGVRAKRITPHSFKRVGYRQARRCPSIRQEHLSARADHRSGNGYTYGAKASKGNVTSGGPDERADCSIAKVLANIPFNNVAFNRAPPHFTSEFALSIPFETICPCYQHLPQNVRKMLPLLLAQLVHHYHLDAGIRSLGVDNPLHLSYLWSDPQGIEYRHELRSNLRGFTYGGAELKTKLRDINCDAFLMNVQGLVNQTVLMRQLPPTRQSAIALKATAELVNDVTDGCIDQSELLAGFEESSFAAPCHHQQTTRILDSSAQADSAPSLLHPTPAPTVRSQTPLPNAALRLPQAPPAFEVPEALDVRTAWFRCHVIGADRQGLWRDKSARDINSLLCGTIRAKMREMLNKALAVCRMLQGQNSNGDVDRIGAAGAFQRCKEKVHNKWGCDILNDGQAAVRTVYLIMTGKSINAFSSLDMEKCKLYRQQCQDSSWSDPAPLQQSNLRTFCAQTNHANGDDDRFSQAEIIGDGNDDGHFGSIDDQVADIDVDDTELLNDTEPCKEIALEGSLLSQTECFVCAICKPNRLFAKWPQYLQHYRSHISGNRLQIMPERDEVQVAMGQKMHARPNSQFCAVSQLYWKEYDLETKLRFFRKRLITRKCLQSGDKIKVKYSDSECKVALVLDPKLKYRQKAHYVTSVRFLTDEDIDLTLEAQEVPLTSILQHWRPRGTQGSRSSTGRLDEFTPIRSHVQHAASPITQVAGTAASSIPLDVNTRASSSPPTRVLASHSPARAQLKPSQLFSTGNLRSLPSSSLPLHATFKSSSSVVLPQVTVPCSATAAKLQKSSSAATGTSTFATPSTGCNTSQQAASAATTQPQLFNASSFARPHRGQNLLPALFNAATSNMAGAASTSLVPARPTIGQSVVECSPLSDADAQLDIGALIMLRDVAQLGSCLRMPLMLVQQQYCNPPTVGIRGGVRFPIFQFEQAAFIDDDYGTKFTGSYPDHVQKVLDAFKLDETHRCFFLALGIGTNIDPFLLQCLFRRHARYIIHNKAVLLNSSAVLGEAQGAIEAEMESLQDVMKPGSGIDCSVLRYLWPIEFDNFRIVVICKRLDRQKVARCNVLVFNSSSTDGVRIQASQDAERKQTIFLKLENGHYTLLTLVHGFLDVSDAHVTPWFAHDINEGLRCPSTTTMQFQEKVFSEAYVACAVDGTVPNAGQIDAIWRRITAGHGISFGSKGEWLTGIPPGVATNNEHQQGSIDAASFENVKNALLNALEAKDNLTASTSRSGSSRASRFAPSVSVIASAPCVHAPLLPASVPCVFLDLGSESGRALVRMLHDRRITHAAGVELQGSWFRLSVTLFQEIRNQFVAEGFRMPAITLFQSCILKQKPELAYIYSIASIAYMNNEVFDKAWVAEPLLTYLPVRHTARRNLSANAAYALSKTFQNRTCIAVFKDEYFNENFSYKRVVAVTVIPTWADWAPYSMFIKSLQQQVIIAPRICLLCASFAEVRNFQEIMRSWSDALAPAYAIIQQNNYYEPESQAHLLPNNAGPVVCGSDSDSSDSEALDTSLLQAVLPSLNSGQVVSDSATNFDTANIQELATLQPRKMLHQNVIKEYMSLLALHFDATSFCPTLMFGTAWEILRSKSQFSKYTFKQRDTFCTQFFKETLRCPNKPIIFAMNPGGNHWIALKIDMHQKYIATACSLKNKMDELAQGVLRMISCHHKPASSFEHFSVDVPYQKNAVDCGPLTCLFMLFFAQNDVSGSTKLEYETEATAVAMRLRIAADIANKELMPLVVTQ